MHTRTHMHTLMHTLRHGIPKADATSVRTHTLTYTYSHTLRLAKPLAQLPHPGQGQVQGRGSLRHTYAGGTLASPGAGLGYSPGKGQPARKCGQEREAGHLCRERTPSSPFLGGPQLRALLTEAGWGWPSKLGLGLGSRRPLTFCWARPPPATCRRALPY